MGSKSSNCTCACCNKSGNNSRRIVNVTSEQAISDLTLCFKSTRIQYGVDICTAYTSRAIYNRHKLAKAAATASDNINTLNSEISNYIKNYLNP